jgi:hypothetical protein
MRHVKCTPPLDPPSQQASINNNSNTTNNTSNNTTNTNNNTINYNIIINPFGQENITHLLSGKSSLDLVYSWTKKSINGMLDCCSHIYFNNDYPENQTIRYLNKKDPFVHIYDGKDWLPQFKEHALKAIVANIENTFVSFFKDIKSLVRNDNEAIVETRKFCKEVACSFDWDIDVFERIFDVRRIEPNDTDEVEKRTNKLHCLIMEHLHLQSNKMIQYKPIQVQDNI